MSPFLLHARHRRDGATQAGRPYGCHAARATSRRLPVRGPSPEAGAPRFLGPEAGRCGAGGDKRGRKSAEREEMVWAVLLSVGVCLFVRERDGHAP